MRVIEHAGKRYELSVVDRTLAWRCDGAVMRPRMVVAALEDYEPVVSMTRAAVAEYTDNRRIRVATLDVACRELCNATVVLNRGLREAFMASGLTSTEVAARCGMTRYAKNKQLVGDSSWLQRRLGMRSESSTTVATPWIHTDVLALIARDGLGVAPREVELGWSDD